MRRRGPFCGAQQGFCVGGSRTKTPPGNVSSNFGVHQTPPRAPGIQKSDQQLPKHRHNIHVSYHDKGKLSFWQEKGQVMYCDGTKWLPFSEHLALEQSDENGIVEKCAKSPQSENSSHEQLPEQKINRPSLVAQPQKEEREKERELPSLPPLCFPQLKSAPQSPRRSPPPEMITPALSLPEVEGVVGLYCYPSNLLVDDKGRVIMAQSGEIHMDDDNCNVVMGKGNDNTEGVTNLILGSSNMAPNTQMNLLAGFGNMSSECKNILVGSSNSSTNESDILVGRENTNDANTESGSCILMGQNNSIESSDKTGNHVVIGNLCEVSSRICEVPTICFGQANTATGGGNIVLSQGGQCTGEKSMIFGGSCNDAGFNNVLMFGHGITATEANQLAIGSSDHPYTTQPKVDQVNPKGYLKVLLNGKPVLVPYY
jgi:hypothetical protein